MWGTDQASSVEIHGMELLVRNIRCVEKALGDGVKRIYANELSAKNKMRRFTEQQQPVEAAVQ
jgi:N-acetylneuraminate synthase